MLSFRRDISESKFLENSAREVFPIKAIAERYAESLESLTLEADKLKVEVNGILRKMGFKF